MPFALPDWLDTGLLKLGLEAATPITVLIAGWMLKRREQLNAELIRKRIAIYEEVAPQANDILCFFAAVGRWRDMDPARVIDCKRRIDRSMHLYRHFWGGDVWHAYKRFNDACFEEFAAAGQPAKLKLDVAHLRKLMGNAWQDAWLERVASGTHSVATVQRAYEAWMMRFAREIGVKEA